MGRKKVKRLEVEDKRVEKGIGIEVNNYFHLMITLRSSIRSCQVRFYTWCSPTFESQSLPALLLCVSSGPEWLLIPGFGMHLGSH